MMRALWLLVAGVFSTSLMVSADRQARDTAATPTVGSAQLAGQVFGGGTEPRPLRRVIVTATAEGSKVGRSTVTDDQGQFSFSALPAGRFTVTGTKASYLPGAFGVTQPGRSAVPIQLKAGESRSDVSFTLLKGAVVTGAIRTESGDPAANVDVTVFRLPAPGTDPRLVMAGIGTADDRGVYRIFDLAPGVYVVAGALRRLGSSGDAAAWTAAQVTEMLRELEQREKAGPASSSADKLPVPPVGSFAYAPVFFPGSPSPEFAMPIRLRASEERNGIDFTVQLTRLATIEGLLIGADAATSAMFFNPVGVQLPPLMGNTPVFSSQAESGGRAFKYAGVNPGRYTITAQARNGTWARADVLVTGDDVHGVTMALQPALRMSGQVVFKGARLTPPDNIGAVSVRLSAANALGQSSTGGTRMGNPLIQPATIQSDGRFEVTGILPDTYRLTATLPGNTGWWLRSAIVNGRDLLDTMVDVTGDIGTAVLTFSDQRASLSGQLLTGGGPPAAPYYIVVFPPDRSLWLPLARRIVSTRADTTGRWILRDLPPGDYLVAALTDLAPDELADPTFLEQLLPAALKVTLTDGEDKTQDLRIGG